MLKKIYKQFVQSVMPKKAQKKKSNEQRLEELTQIAKYCAGFKYISSKLDFISRLLENDILTPKDVMDMLSYSNQELLNYKAIKEFKSTGLGKELQ